MKIILQFLIVVFILATPSILKAQAIPNLGQTDRWMTGALAAMEREDYETANSIFRNLIDSGLPLPEEMPYFFALTLFELGQYDNSASFLDKYFDLNGFKGQNYELAKNLQGQLKEPLQAIRACNLCDTKGYRYELCETCQGAKNTEQDCSYCRGAGVVGCSRCAATGMITKRNIFNIIEYYECDRCNGKGRLECPTCKGSLKEISECKTCSGFGKIASDVICDHKEHEHDHAESKSEN